MSLRLLLGWSRWQQEWQLEEEQEGCSLSYPTYLLAQGTLMGTHSPTPIVSHRPVGPFISLAVKVGKRNLWRETVSSHGDWPSTEQLEVWGLLRIRYLGSI